MHSAFAYFLAEPTNFITAISVDAAQNFHEQIPAIPCRKAARQTGQQTGKPLKHHSSQNRRL